MNKILPLFIIAIAIIILLPLAASAEIREGTFELSPFVGYCTGSTSRTLCHKDIIGVRAGYLFTENWELEGALEFVHSAAELYHVDALYHFMPKNKTVNPFLLAGFGWAHVRPKNGDQYSTPMADIGAGVKIFLTDRIALRTEIRDVITHSQNAVVTAGLTFTFGGKTPKAAPAPQPAPVAAPEPKHVPAPEPVPVAPEKKPEPAPQPAPVAEPAPVKIVLEDIHFGHDKAALTPAAKETLAGYTKLLRENSGVRLEIEGHTSSIGSEAYNLKLSIRRANAVKDYFVKEGIAPERLQTVGYGERHLAMPEPNPKKRNDPPVKANRRVHFKVIIQ